ncbi:MAG: bifunctional 3,4-dihydroxy-2-butanone-4-phosphate synthase/GTP cyclohydrolase II [Aquificaceae bacterium]|nr:bifunctional 3,4-dihydroxy-2-butanone-4-phosphate synthase/GTP cyclohydrolase II [Aquificaceae bacterium]
MNSDFNSIEEAIADIAEGKMVIVVDDPSRENEGDLVMAAEKATPDAINFMSKYGRGLICLSLTQERCQELGLEPLSTHTPDQRGTAFCTPIDAHPRFGTSTGISAFDRATTIRLAVSPNAKPTDFVRPGHIFTLRARPGGVLQRAGHTEASVDLAKLSGCYPAGVICEIMKDDGTMARVPDLLVFAKEFGLKIITIADLIRYRLKRERLVIREATASLPTRHGLFYIHAYKHKITGEEQVALTMGEWDENEPVLVRVHSECLTGDVFKSLRCDCRGQLESAMEAIASAGKGVLVYIMGHEGRGIGIVNKIKAYHLQDKGYDTAEANETLGYPADLREYGIGVQILLDLGVRRMKLLTNNPRKIIALEGYGLEVVERIPLKIPPCEHNQKYLQAKKDKLGHLF